MRLLRLLLGVLLLSLSMAPFAHAQSGSLAGRIVDAQGAAVANADVTLTAASQRTRTTRSNAEGAFVFADLANGAYTAVVRAPGFADRTLQASVASSTASVTVTLAVAGIVTDVTVQGALLGTAATGKTNVPLRDQPLTVHSVPNYLIQEQGVNDLASALQNVPGVYAFTNYGAYEGYTFRGFLDLFPSLANQLVDGVRQEGNRINTQLVDVDRIEVLKGPSSALYGGGAIGATVNIIRKQATAQPAYEFSAAAGSWNLGRASFGATGKLQSDSLLYRLDIGAETKEGYRHNETRRLQIAPSVAWRVGAHDQVNIHYTFNRDRFAGDAGIPLLDTDFGTPLPESTFPDVPRDRNYRTPFDFVHPTEHSLQLAYARQFSDSWGFRNTFAYRPVNDDYFLAEFLAVDGAPNLYREYLQFTHHRRPVTNLAEITGHLTRGVDQNLVLGWEAEHFPNRTDTIPDGGVLTAEPIDLFNPVETQQQPSESIARRSYSTQNTNALYAQDNLTLASNLKASIGGRLDMYRRESHRNAISDGVETEGASTRREADAVTGRVGLVYQPRPMLDIYGSFANSFRPLTDAQPDGTTLEPERGRQFEIGQRTHLMNDRVQFDATVFSIVRNNVALSRPGGRFDQVGEITSNGLELEMSTSLASNWRVNGGYGFTNAKFGDYQIDATTNLKGNGSIMAPKHIFNVWSSYDWANGFGINVGLRTQSRLFIDSGNQFTIDGYGLLNAGARYRRGPVEYSVVVNNLTDTEYFASVLYDSQMYPGEPVNVLGTVRIRLR